MVDLYASSTSATLFTPTADTLEITKAALHIVDLIYKPGILYKKSGVIVSDIKPLSPYQSDLFDPIGNRPERNKLMNAVDAINHRYGLKTLQLAVEGEKKQAWKVKSEHRSPNYLTDINDILTVKA